MRANVKWIYRRWYMKMRENILSPRCLRCPRTYYSCRDTSGFHLILLFQHRKHVQKNIMKRNWISDSQIWIRNFELIFILSCETVFLFHTIDTEFVTLFFWMTFTIIISLPHQHYWNQLYHYGTRYRKLHLYRTISLPSIRHLIKVLEEESIIEVSQFWMQLRPSYLKKYWSSQRFELK